MPELNAVLDTKKETVKKDVVIDAKIVAKKPKKEKAVKVEIVKPPISQFTKDFETEVSQLKLNGQPIIKLGYKCGKIVWGLKTDEKKDIRVFAYKARKKSKSVEGKSRGIFYFGLDSSAKELTKTHPQTKISQFGQCSVQSKTPVELVLDKETFTNTFDKNIDNVMKIAKILMKKTIEDRTKVLASKSEISKPEAKSEKVAKTPVKKPIKKK